MSDRLSPSWKSAPVCILGMHRSGTSLVANVAHALGVYLGSPEQLMRPGADNPRGFWEHEPLKKINDEILSRFGGSWDKPPHLPHGWPVLPELADLRQQALALLQQDFAAAVLWGWKDPRLCLTLPFWQQIVQPRGYIICLRNPVDVARSLEHRDRFSFAASVDLWLAYINGALQHTADQPRLFVSYEDLITDWRRELPRLAAFLGCPQSAQQEDRRRLVEQIVDASLEHSRTNVAAATDDPGISFAARALYLTLRLCPDNVDPSLRHALQRFSTWARRTDMDVGGLMAAAREHEQRADTLRAELDAKTTDLIRHQAELENGREQNRQLQADLTQRDQHLAGLRQQSQQLEERLQLEMAVRDERIEALQRELGRAEQIARQVESLRREMEILRDSLFWPTIGRILVFWPIVVPYRVLRPFCRRRSVREARLRRALVVGSASMETVFCLIEKLRQRWPRVQFTVLVHSSLEDEARRRWPQVIVRAADRSSALDLLYWLWRQNLDVTVVALTGDEGLGRYKAIAFLSGPRQVLSYNENLDCFSWMLGRPGPALRHLRWRRRQQGRPRLSKRMWLYYPLRIVGYGLCLLRCLPLLARGLFRHHPKQGRERS